MFSPEGGFEVAPDEFDGSVEAFVGWDVGRRSFEGLRMAGRGRMAGSIWRRPFDRLRVFNIRHVGPIGVGACALAR